MECATAVCFQLPSARSFFSFYVVILACDINYVSAIWIPCVKGLEIRKS